MERVNSVIEQYLRCFTNYRGSNWIKYISLAEFSYNNTIQNSTNNSPFFLNYGFNPRHSPAVPPRTNVPRADMYTKDFSKLIKELKMNIENSINIQKKYADKNRLKPPKLNPGDLFYINFKLFNRTGNKKLHPRNLGPFKVLERISDVSYKIDLPKNFRIHPIIHIEELEPFPKDKFNREDPLPPTLVNGHEEYEVEKVLDKRKHYGKIQYLIKWKGYPHSESSWEPESNLNCPDLI